MQREWQRKTWSRSDDRGWETESSLQEDKYCACLRTAIMALLILLLSPPLNYKNTSQSEDYLVLVL